MIESVQTAECSALRNAERLVAICGDSIRYCDGVGWLAWDGRRWKADAPLIVEKCKYVLRTLYAHALEELLCAEYLLAEATKAEREDATRMVRAAKAHVTFLGSSQDPIPVAKMMNFASSDPAIRLDVERLDAGEELLNCWNGTVNLRTGALKPHDPADLITRVSPVVYDPNADRSYLDLFLASVTMNDPDMIEEMRILAGYTLLGGPNRENVFVFCLGDPGSGKGTFNDMLRCTLGNDYSSTVKFSVFLKQNSPQELRPKMLFGKRMICSSEANANDKIDEGTLSSMTGGDQQTARALYKDEFSFTPICTPWFQINDPPAVNSDPSATGFFRRVHTLHFRHVLSREEKKKEVKDILTDPHRGGPAVLQWAVSGARAYLATGKIPMSGRSRARADKLRSDNDPISSFVTSHLCLAPGRGPLEEEEDYRTRHAGTWIRQKDFRRLYEAHCEAEGVRPVSGQKVRKLLSSAAYGCGERRVSGSSERFDVWTGIRERRETDESTAEPAASAWTGT